MKNHTPSSHRLVIHSRNIKSSLQPYDIICGRCSMAFNNVGNRRFRVTISLNLKRYVDAPTRREKSAVIKKVVDVLLGEAGARFLKKKGDEYWVLDQRHVRQKVQHALRDMAAFKIFDDDESDDSGGADNVDKSKQQQQQQQKTKDDNNREREDTNKQTEEEDDSMSLVEYSPFVEEERMLISTIETSPPLKAMPEPIGKFVHLTPAFEEREISDHFLNQGESVGFFQEAPA